MENEVKLIGYLNSILQPISKSIKVSVENSSELKQEEWTEYPFVVGVKRSKDTWDNIYCISKKPIELKENDLVEVKGSLRVDSWKDKEGNYKNKWYVTVYHLSNHLEDLKNKKN